MFVAEEEQGWRLTECDVYLERLADDDERTSSIMIARPSTSPELWDAIFSLLRLGNGVFYFPGSSLYVASQSAIGHLPPEMIEALGPPTLAGSGSRLSAAVKA